MNQALTIAHKEILDGLRDLRSIVASLFYALMGPAVVGLVSMATRANAKPDSGASVLTGMMAIFTLVAAFVGGMNVAMDTVAGERERRSLLPLLLNPVSRRSVVLGKWLAVSFFCPGRADRKWIGVSAGSGKGGNPPHCIRDVPLVAHCHGSLLAAIACCLDTIVDFNDLSRSERGTDLSLSAGVSSDGDRHVSGVQSRGEAGMACCGPSGGATVADGSDDERARRRIV